MIEIKCAQWLDSKMRYVVIDNNIWFVLRDICKALEIKNCREVVRQIRKKGNGDFIKHEYIPDSMGREQAQNIVMEDVVYTDVIGRSKKKEARKFVRWMGETIRTIRQTGKFEMKEDENMFLEESKDWFDCGARSPFMTFLKIYETQFNTRENPHFWACWKKMKLYGWIVKPSDDHTWSFAEPEIRDRFPELTTLVFREIPYFV